MEVVQQNPSSVLWTKDEKNRLIKRVNEGADLDDLTQDPILKNLSERAIQTKYGRLLEEYGLKSMKKRVTRVGSPWPFLSKVNGNGCKKF